MTDNSITLNDRQFNYIEIKKEIIPMTSGDIDLWPTIRSLSGISIVLPPKKPIRSTATEEFGDRQTNKQTDKQRTYGYFDIDNYDIQARNLQTRNYDCKTRDYIFQARNSIVQTHNYDFQNRSHFFNLGITTFILIIATFKLVNTYSNS